MKENFLLYGLFCPITDELKYSSNKIISKFIKKHE